MLAIDFIALLLILSIHITSYILSVFTLDLLVPLYTLFSVGPNNMPCQLMVGFFAYAKSLDINVDKGELEGMYNFLRHRLVPYF